MLDSCCQYLSGMGRKVVMIQSRSKPVNIRWPVEVAHPQDGSPLERVAALREVLSCGALAFIGADVIDGVYGVDGDCKRLGLLDLAARAGMKTAAINFSVSATPGATATQRLRALPQMPMHARDPVSVDRFRTLTGREPVAVADVAFLLTPEARAPEAQAAIAWIREQKAAGRRVLAVNAGGTTFAKMKGDGVAALAECLENWLAASPDRAVLVLPHDYKPAPVGDVKPLEQVAERLSATSPDRVRMVRFPFGAWDAKAIAGEVDCALVARMHFAIACLGMGVPALCVVYQGKFEGLMQHFGLKDVLIPLEEAHDPRVLADRLAGFEARLPELRAQIAARLPAVKALSERNFAWL